MPSNEVAYSLGGLAGLGLVLERLDRQRRAAAFQEMSLAKDQGTFVPVSEGEQPPQSFLQRLFGGGTPLGYYDLGGGKMYRLEPYAALGEEGARAMGLTAPVTESYAPMQHLPLDDTPAGPLFQTLPTPSTVTTDAVIPGAADIRLGPKERLEMLKDAARLKRDQAVAAARTERTRLWLTRTPASISKYEWLINNLGSDDPTTQELAQAELSRLQAPGRRADTAEDRLDQTYTMHRERLQGAMDMLATRLEAAKARNDTRTQAALERQRERFQERLDEMDILESGRNYRTEYAGDVKLEVAGKTGTRTGEVADMKVDDALAKLKEFRGKMYFPGQSAAALDTLERVVGQLKQGERSHVGLTIARRIQRLGDTLERAERREGVRPQTPQSPATAPGRQSAAPGTPAGALIRTYEDMYRRLTPEQAEADLNETLTDPVKSRSPMAKAKLAAFANLNMRLPTETTLPEAPPPAPPAAAPAPVAAPAPATPVVAQPPAAAAPQTRATAPPQAPQTPQPQVAPRQAPLTPQAQALLGRFVAAYNPLSDQDLDREEARLQSGVAGADVINQYRQKAIQIIRDRRTSPGGPLDQGPGEPSPMPGTQGTAPPVTRSPARTSKGQPQGLDQHNAYVAQYRDLTPQALQAEARRVLLRDPFSTSAESNFRLTALNQLLDERKAQKPHGELVDEPTLARYRTEVKDWSTARLMEQSSTLRGSIVAMLDVLAQARPEAFAAIDKAARLAREAHALGGGVASFPGAIAALPFAAPFVWGVALKSLATAFPEAAAAMKDVYHKQLAVGLELHERLQPRNAPSAADEAAD